MQRMESIVFLGRMRSDQAAKTFDTCNQPWGTLQYVIIWISEFLCL